MDEDLEGYGGVDRIGKRNRSDELIQTVLVRFVLSVHLKSKRERERMRALARKRWGREWKSSAEERRNMEARAALPAVRSGRLSKKVGCGDGGGGGGDR